MLLFFFFHCYWLNLIDAIANQRVYRQMRRTEREANGRKIHHSQPKVCYRTVKYDESKNNRVGGSDGKRKETENKMILETQKRKI